MVDQDRRGGSTISAKADSILEVTQGPVEGRGEQILQDIVGYLLVSGSEASLLFEPLLPFN